MFDYDASQRLVRQYEYWTNRTPTVRNDKKTTYDLAGRVVCQWMVGASGACDATSPARVEYAYDVADRLTEEKQDGRAVNYAYDPAGNRTGITWPDGKAAAYSYTARHQLAGVSFEAVALAAYSYDIQGFDAVRRRRTKRIAFRAENAPSAGEGPERATGATFGNGNSAAVGHEVDDDLSLLAYALKDEAGAAQALEWTYTYTNAHRLASQAVTLPAHDWSPPANVTTSYSAPSMAPATEAANAVDQYEQIGESINGGAAQNSALSYDVRGNLISDTVWTYTYDLENRMLTATASGTSCASGCSYAYDPMGRRVSKTVGSTVTKFLRAGPAEIAEYDGSGNLLRRYVPGAGPDTFVVWIEGTGTTSASMKWILADRQGSVAVVTDSTGKATQRFAYDPFGNETAGAPGTGFPFRYTGQRFDPETGLYYYKARYYSAKLGRFLQTDPIGYADNMNLYAYVGNDPTNATDPIGTQCNASRVGNEKCGDADFWFGYSEFVKKVRESPAARQLIAPVTGTITPAQEREIKKRVGFFEDGPSTLGMIIYVASVEELLIAKETGERARSSTEKKYGYSGQDDESDAYRHAVWAIAMTQRMGPGMAKAFGDAHERDRPHNTRGARLMDLINNHNARILATLFPDMTPEELAEMALMAGLLQTGRVKIQGAEK